MAPKVLIALSPRMLAEIDKIAVIECRTRSDLIREALRRYLTAFQRDSLSIQKGIKNDANI